MSQGMGRFSARASRTTLATRKPSATGTNARKTFQMTFSRGRTAGPLPGIEVGWLGSRPGGGLHDALEDGQVGGEGFPAFFGGGVSGVGLLLDELLVHGEVAGLFEPRQMDAQVAVGDRQRVLQEPEIARAARDKSRHDSQ